jgi:hypothetical protein
MVEFLTAEILILWQLRKIVPSVKKSLQQCLCISTVVSPDPLPPSPSTSSAMKTPDLQSPGPLPSLVETDETPGNREGDPAASEQIAEGEIQMEYSSDSCAAQI